MPSITNDALAQSASNQRELDSLKEGLIELQGYLLSDKFREDTTVQVDDILRRIAEIKIVAWDASWPPYTPVD